MLQILNAQERNKAFGKFIFLLLLTLVSITIAVFFSWRTPMKANNLLNEKLTNYQLQEIEQRSFTMLIDTTKSLIDSLGSNPRDVPYQKSLIEDKLKQLSAQAGSDGIYADQNKRMITVFYRYYDSKVLLLSLPEARKQIEQLKEDLHDCKNDRPEARSVAPPDNG